jgi:plastocyanin/mono/diheme cytochrome c family protein
VVLGLVGLASVLILYVADEPNRLDTQAEEQIHDAVERGTLTYLSQCIACHGPAGEGYTAPGESGTGRIGAPIGGDTPNRLLNQTGIVQTGPNAGKPWSDPANPQYGSGLEGRANFIRYRIHNGMRTSDGSYLMPAFGQEFNGPLNDSQIDELVTFIQNADWNEVYNEAIEVNHGYPTPAPSEEAATPAGGEASPVGGPGEGTTIEVDMVDVAFQETELRIPANTDVTINAVNKGSLPHTFTITDLVDTGEVPGGSNKEVTVNLPAGEYEFFCAVPGHKDAGMVGKLIVEEGAEAVQPTDATPASGTPAAQGGDETEAAGGPIEVDMAELAFNPAEITVPADTEVTIHAVNSGSLPHTFTITDVADTGEVAAGSSKDVTVNLPAGEYEYFCAIPGHKDGGMVGKLIVK